MKRCLPVLCLLFAAVTVWSQTVTKVELAKDNGKGKPGQVVKGFAPSDSPIHCVLSVKPLPYTIMFTGTLIATSAGKYRAYTVATTNISGVTRTESIDFKFGIQGQWPTGSYKIELKANGKSVRDVSFEIK